ncbi:beta-ketoacyl synthase N-terminal-like domain-containing protein, partial [Streptomyces sp. CB01635]|uniref:beta-ketoacyl synthase N-terminal-like domain-containing protein n=1 Tax=Streptomyces sp. CB01635 TaxID=2020326 RepID=UPI0018FE1753
MSDISGAVAVTAASVLTPLADDLDGFTAALLAGRSAVTLPAADDDGESLPVAALDGFALADWAGRHLADDPATAARLRKVAGRAALPARTAACVALRAVRDSGLTRDQLADGTALIVAGSNLAREPASSRNRRANVRRLICAWSASSASVSGRSRWSSAHSLVAAV